MGTSTSTQKQRVKYSLRPAAENHVRAKKVKREKIHFNIVQNNVDIKIQIV